MLAAVTTSAVVNVPEPKWSAVLVVKDQFQVVTAKALLGAKKAPRVAAAAQVLRRSTVALKQNGMISGCQFRALLKGCSAELGGDDTCTIGQDREWR